MKNIMDYKVVAGSRIGGFWLRETIARVIEGIAFPVAGTPQEPPRYQLNNEYIVSHRTEDDKIWIYSDLRVGLVSQILLNDTNGFDVPDGIQVGDSFEQAKAKRQDLSFDEINGVAVTKSRPGIFFELEDPDPNPKDLPGLRIVSIGIEDPALSEVLESRISAQRAEEIRKEFVRFGSAE